MWPSSTLPTSWSIPANSPAVGGLGEAEGAGEEEGGLGSVAAIQLEMVDPMDRHSIHVGDRRGSRRQLLCGHPPPSSASRVMFPWSMRRFNACLLQLSYV